jgi:hypothetical protein
VRVHASSVNPADTIATGPHGKRGPKKKESRSTVSAPAFHASPVRLRHRLVTLDASATMSSRARMITGVGSVGAYWPVLKAIAISIF